MRKLNVKFLMIDEISMISLDILNKIHVNIQLAKDSNLPFIYMVLMLFLLREFIISYNRNKLNLLTFSLKYKNGKITEDDWKFLLTSLLLNQSKLPDYF